jgi:hypothetical protein
MDFLLRTEVEATPVDDRVTAKDESDRLEIGERELVKSLEAIDLVAVWVAHGPRGP